MTHTDHTNLRGTLDRAYPWSRPHALTAVDLKESGYIERVGSGKVEVAISARKGLPAKHFSFRQPVVQIGATSSCDIIIEDDRLHGKRLVLCALPNLLVPIEFSKYEKSDGLIGQSTKADGRLIVDSASVLSVGGFEVSVRLVLPDGSPAPVCRLLLHSENPQNVQMGLQFLNARSRRSVTTRRYIRKCVTLIGKRYPSHIKLGNADIADIQCSLFRDGHRLFIENLYPDEKMKVNGQVALESELVVGDRIQIAQFEAELFVEESTDDSPLPQHLTLPAAVLSILRGSSDLRRPPVTNEVESPSGEPAHLPTPVRVAQQNLSLVDALQPLANAVGELAEAHRQTAQQAKYQCELLAKLISELGASHGDVVRGLFRRAEALESQIQALQSEHQALKGAHAGASSHPPIGLPLIPSDLVTRKPDPDPAAVAAHQGLSDRLFQLESERSSCIQRILKLFGIEST